MLSLFCIQKFKGKENRLKQYIIGLRKIQFMTNGDETVQI